MKNKAVPVGKNKLSLKQKLLRNDAMWCYIMLALPIIGFLVLRIYPILWTFRWSFFSYDGVASHTRFIGFDNFKTLFTTDFTYWKTWCNTLLFAVIKIPVEITLAMGLALMLNKKLKGSGFFQALFYLPNIISMAIIGLILSNMFNYNGIVNALLMKIGTITEPIDWFSTKTYATTMIVLGSVWAHFGVNVMYLLAALANVDEDLYECATLDGASKTRVFFSITLPMIAPVFQTILLLALLNALSINEYIIVLTNGAPHGETNSVMSYLYTKFVPGFAETSNPPLGYGCAMSLLTTFIFAGVSMAYNKFSNKMKNLY